MVSVLCPCPRVQQERLALMVSVATLDHQAHQENRDFLVPQERREPKETLDPQEALVKMDLLDCEASLVREDCQEHP